MDAREVNFIASCPWEGGFIFSPKKQSKGHGIRNGNLGQRGLRRGGAGFGVLPPGNYGSQAKADEKTNYEGNHFFFSQ
jgi:hypothetical protein